MNFWGHITALAITAGLFCSCSLTLKTDINPMGKRTLEASMTVAPLITVSREDTLPSGENHKQTFFGVTPVPTTEKVTEKHSEKTVSETETTKATPL